MCIFTASKIVNDFCFGIFAVLKKQQSSLKIGCCEKSQHYFITEGYEPKPTLMRWPSPSQMVISPINECHRFLVDFCKSYYNFPESDVIGVFYSRHDVKVEVNHVVNIPPEPMTTRARSGRVVEIPIPSSYVGQKSLQARLIAPFRSVSGTEAQSVQSCLVSRVTICAQCYD